MAARIETLQRQITRFEDRIRMHRDKMDHMMDMMPEEQNAKMIAQMARIMNLVGIYQERIAGFQLEMEIIELAGGNREMERKGTLAVRRLSRALSRLGNLHRRGITGPRLERQLAEVARAQQDLAAIIPIGGEAPPPPGQPTDPTQPPTNPGEQPPLVVLTRDPRKLANGPHFNMEFDAFSCMVPHGSPETPDVLPPTFSVFREFRTADITMPDGKEVEFWGFVGEGEDGTYPSKIIRVPQGALFHGEMKPRKGTHTIHWHGIEPTAMNDGVGKLSFEVNSRYTYQWFAAEPGHYFYHCHHNTPLHFEIGMVGPLMVDPTPPSDLPQDDPLWEGFRRATEPGGYPTGGPGYTLRANGLYQNEHGDRLERYEAEAIWFVDDVDPRWHEQSHDHGLGCPFGEDAGHNIFEPKYFLITGVPQGRTGFAQTVEVRAGEKLLLRLVCGSYSLMTNVFRPASAADAGLVSPQAGLPGTIIAMDARTLGHGPFMQYSQEVPLAPGQEFEMTAARRFDILFEPQDEHVGDHLYRAEFFKYVSKEGEIGPKHIGALGIDGANALIRVLPRE